MARDVSARLPVTPETRDRVRALKRGGESYDELLQKMAEQYDPSADACLEATLELEARIDRNLGVPPEPDTFFSEQAEEQGGC